MPYIITKDSKNIAFGESAVIDLPAFASDLAKALGGKLQPPDEYPDRFAKIAIGNVMLSLCADNHKRKVNISAAPAELKWGEYDVTDKRQQTDSVSLNPDGRKLASIAKDVAKRAIEANQAAFQARRDYAAAKLKAISDGASVAERLKKATPSVDLRPDGSGYGTFYISNPYISGRWYPNGDISIDRIGSLPLEKFAQIVKLLES